MAWGENVTDFLLLSIGLENNYFYLELISGHGINLNLKMKTIGQPLYCIVALPYGNKWASLRSLNLATSIPRIHSCLTSWQIVNTWCWTKCWEAVLFNYVFRSGCGKNFNNREEYAKWTIGLILNFNNATDTFPTAFLLGLYFCF